VHHWCHATSLAHRHSWLTGWGPLCGGPDWWQLLMAVTDGVLLGSFHSVSEGSDPCYSHSQAQLSEGLSAASAPVLHQHLNWVLWCCVMVW